MPHKLNKKKRSYIVMIKLNDICIQYAAWCRDTATSLIHTPWSTRLGLARSQHKNRIRLYGFEGSIHGTGSESRMGNLFLLWLADENQKSIE